MNLAERRPYILKTSRESLKEQIPMHLVAITKPETRSMTEFWSLQCLTSTLRRKIASASIHHKHDAGPIQEFLPIISRTLSSHPHFLFSSYATKPWFERCKLPRRSDVVSLFICWSRPSAQQNGWTDQNAVRGHRLAWTKGKVCWLHGCPGLFTDTSRGVYPP